MADAVLNLDTTMLPEGANEELAGPPHAIAPVQRAERVASVDVLRGFALLGILLMNITSFGLPAWAYAVPLSTPLPVFSGPHARLNTIAWFLRWILAEGKMRALFSMLFGAGVILLTDRAEKRGAGIRAADIYTRRNMWLVLFGMVHAYFIWYGDILFWYGMTGLLFLFPFRTLKVKTLIRSAVVVFVVSGLVVEGGQYAHMYFGQKKAVEINALLHAGKPITDDQVDSLKDWKDTQDQFRPPQKTIDEDVTAMRKGYWSAMGHNAKEVLQTQTLFYYLGFGDVLSFMLLGMAMYRCGFLTAKWSNRSYTLVAVVGLAVSWVVGYEGCIHAYRSHFDQFTSFRWLNFPYDLGRITGALGNAAALLLIFKSGGLRWLMRGFSGVGQMALSNYLLTSFSMKMLFVWGPWKLYGRMEYYRLYEVVLGVWIVNMVWSWVWLRYFQFGPVEWLWRSLTYWKRQPMLRRETAGVEVAA